MLSRDLRLDGRRRAAIRITLIQAPGVGLLAWAHYAPILGDSFRKTYRRLLRWNDELPFVKFALAEDERIMLTAEVPAAALDVDAVGRTLARLVAVCDLLIDESASFLGDWAKLRPAAPTPLLGRYAADVAELEAPAEAPDPDASAEAPDPLAPAVAEGPDPDAPAAAPDAGARAAAAELGTPADTASPDGARS